MEMAVENGSMVGLPLSTGSNDSIVKTPPHSGMLWKRSVGRSSLSRKNWKFRYFLADEKGLLYKEKESDPTAKSLIPWTSVTHLYATVGPAIDKDARDPSHYYFGLRFFDDEKAATLGFLAPTSVGSEKLLLMRSDSSDDRNQWISAFAGFIADVCAATVQPDEFIDAFDEEEELDPEEGHDETAVICNRAHRALRVQRMKAQSKHTTKQKEPGVVDSICRKLRSLVSLQKLRFQSGDLDLDLAYITPKVIAMGYPSEGREALYRNSMDDVVLFFNRHHPNVKFMVYNLCSERFYPPSRFYGKFERYPFDDHNPPPLALVEPFCKSVHQFLNTDTENVVAVHCKAGKGRTGVMIIAYMLYSGQCASADEAIHEFAIKRTKDGKGVTIPSQKRYIGYIARMFSRHRITYQDPKMEQATKARGKSVIETVPIQDELNMHTIQSISMSSIPHFDRDGGCDPFIIVERRKPGHGHVPQGKKEGKFNNALETIYDSRLTTEVIHYAKTTPMPLVLDLNFPIPPGVQEIRVSVLDHDKKSKDESMFSFWVHIGYLPFPSDDPEAPQYDGHEETGELRLTKVELDDAVKDKKHVLFDQDFAVTFRYSRSRAGFTAGDSLTEVIPEQTQEADEIPIEEEEIRDLSERRAGADAENPLQQDAFVEL